MTTRPYMVGFQQFKVDNCRSKGDHNDSDWLTVTVSTDRDVLPSKAVPIGGNLHAGDIVNDVFAGPFDIDDGALVTVTFKVVNLRKSENEEKQAAQIALGVGAAVAGVLASEQGIEAIAAGALKDFKLFAELGAAILGGVTAVLGGLAGILVQLGESLHPKGQSDSPLEGGRGV